MSQKTFTYEEVVDIVDVLFQEHEGVSCRPSLEDVLAALKTSQSSQGDSSNPLR